MLAGSFVFQGLDQRVDVSWVFHGNSTVINIENNHDFVSEQEAGVKSRLLEAKVLESLAHVVKPRDGSDHEYKLLMCRRQVLGPLEELKPRGRWIHTGSLSLTWTKAELKSTVIVFQSRISDEVRKRQTVAQAMTGAYVLCFSAWRSPHTHV